MTRELLIEGINSLYERGEFEKHKDRKSFPVKDEGKLCRSYFREKRRRDKLHFRKNFQKAFRC